MPRGEVCQKPGHAHITSFSRHTNPHVRRATHEFAAPRRAQELITCTFDTAFLFTVAESTTARLQKVHMLFAWWCRNHPILKVRQEVRMQFIAARYKG